MESALVIGDDERGVTRHIQVVVIGQYAIWNKLHKIHAMQIKV
jgi:hypothetical protein